MSYMVYHKSLLPEYLTEEKDYIQYLLTDEWFDRPQTNNEGNRDETERLLRPEGRILEHKYNGLQQDGREILRDPDVTKREVDANEIDKNRITEGSEKEILVVKKRGRPKKDKLNVDSNN